MTTMTMMAVVAVGGAIGAVLRYSISLLIGAGIFGVSGPMASLVVNVAGSALMGCLAGSVASGLLVPEVWRGFLAVGVLGALTTFSSFAMDAGHLWQTKGAMMTGAYVMASVVMSLMSFAAMYMAARHSGIWQ